MLVNIFENMFLTSAYHYDIWIYQDVFIHDLILKTISLFLQLHKDILEFILIYQ